MPESKSSRNVPYLVYLVVFLMPIFAADNFPLFTTGNSGVFVWELLVMLLWGWVAITRPETVAVVLRNRPVWFVGALVLWLIVSLLWASVFHATLFEVMRWFTAFLLFMTIMQTKPDKDTQKKLLVALFAGVALVAIYAIYQAIWGFDTMLNYAIDKGFSKENIKLLQETQRPFSTFFHTNALAGYLAAMIPIGLFLFSVSKEKVGRISILLGMLLILIALMMTSSRGGWLCALIGLVIAVAYFVRGRSWKWIAGIAAAAILVLTIFVSLQSLVSPERDTIKKSPVERIKMLIDSPYDVSSISRIGYWETAWNMGLDHQPHGAGLGAFEHLNRKYLTKPLYSRSPHNIWVQFFSEIGLIGLALFIALLVVIFRGGLRHHKKGGKAGEGIFYILLSIAVLLLHASIDLDVDGPASYATLFLFAGFILCRDLNFEKSKGTAVEGIVFTMLATFVIIASFAVNMLIILSGNYKQLASLALENGSVEKAASLARESVEMWPHDPVSQYQYSKLLTRIYSLRHLPEFLDKAIEVNKTALRLNPEQPEYYAGMALLHRAKKEPRQALEFASKASGLYPVGIRYHALYAQLLAGDKQEEKALSLIEQALSHEDDYILYQSPDGYDLIEIRFIKAAILNQMEKFDGAIAEYDRITELTKKGLFLGKFSSGRKIDVEMSKVVDQATKYRNESQIRKLAGEKEKQATETDLDQDGTEAEKAETEPK